MSGRALGALAAWLRLRLPPDADLDHAALLMLAHELAEQPSLWRRHVRHDPGQRVYVQLHRDQHLDAWLICWMDAQVTGLHDHDVSAGAVRVIDGRLAEDRVVLGQPTPDTTIYAPGEAFSFDPSRIHEVRHAGGPPATSLHLDAPPLWRMGFYEVGADGRLSRRAATYAEELVAAG